MLPNAKLGDFNHSEEKNRGDKTSHTAEAASIAWLHVQDLYFPGTGSEQIEREPLHFPIFIYKQNLYSLAMKCWTR